MFIFRFGICYTNKTDFYITYKLKNKFMFVAYVLKNYLTNFDNNFKDNSKKNHKSVKTRE